MILYYANGGGLGHLKRTSAVIHTLKLNPQKIILLTASPYYYEDFLPHLYKVIFIPLSFESDIINYRNWLKNIIIEYNIQDIFLDVFPVGLVGEWQDLKNWLPLPYPSFHLIARLLNWKNYQSLLDNDVIFFQSVYVVETLNQDVNNYLINHSNQIENLSLVYPEFNLSKHESDILQELKKDKFGLIIHSSPIEELEFLIESAQTIAILKNIELKWVIISKTQKNLKNYLFLDTYQPEEFVKQATLVLTGGGFNSIELAKKYPQKHFINPFERFYDLQFDRVANWRKNYKKN